MTFLVQLKDRDTITVRETFAKEFKHLPKGLKRSLTYDQGQEMAEHKLFTKSTKDSGLFCASTLTLGTWH
jgi:transposase, IS30 family